MCVHFVVLNFSCHLREKSHSESTSFGNISISSSVSTLWCHQRISWSNSWCRQAHHWWTAEIEVALIHCLVTCDQPESAPITTTLCDLPVRLFWFETIFTYVMLSEIKISIKKTWGISKQIIMNPRAKGMCVWCDVCACGWVGGCLDRQTMC